MSTTALPNNQTIDMKSLAVQCQQLKDNNGNATNVSDLTNASSGNRYKAAGSTLTLTSADNNKTVKLDTAAGSVVTLPAASGSGVRFAFLVTVLATSNSHIVKVANASDAMQGYLASMSDNSNAGLIWFATAGTSDTITLNRTTTGSVTKGEMFTIEDIATNVWQVSGTTSSTGTEATPFSATV